MELQFSKDIMELGYHPIDINFGFYLDKIPQNVFNELTIPVNLLKKDFNKGVKSNHKLAGEIKHEYDIPIQPTTKEYIMQLSQKFENKSRYYAENYDDNHPLKIDSLWLNFQKKYEYNPIHNHLGVYSFVIWYQIPYTFEEELKWNYKPLGMDCQHGKFSFLRPCFNNKLTNILSYNLSIDKSKEGYIAIFPSVLDHIVYPFYSSDDYRITVAGNIIESK